MPRSFLANVNDVPVCKHVTTFAVLFVYIRLRDFNDGETRSDRFLCEPQIGQCSLLVSASGVRQQMTRIAPFGLQNI